MNKLENIELGILRLLELAEHDAREAAATEEANGYSDALESMERCEAAGVVSGLAAALALVEEARRDGN